ncbi:YrrS family protein [Heyndrickxia sp. NPDC080065]|uniref:YrrS family protein n=1 Tax=Heyndrickxia sp. NPDC080065 TaxID=3390568 RepID=UPI003D06ABDD
MANHYDNQFRSRSVQRSKRRKTNIILNSLILVVIVLIIVVGCSIFLGGKNNDQKASAIKNNKMTEHKNNDSKSNTTEDTSGSQENTESDSNSTTTDDNNSGKDQENNTSLTDENKQDLDGEDVVAEESQEPNVKKSYTNPNWKSVGTEQTNGHQYSSDANSIDWKEKTAALSYATGISQDNLTIWFLGRDGGSDNEVTGTVSPKNDSSKVYRVYLNWVDGEGWKPTKVLELEKNDKR